MKVKQRVQRARVKPFKVTCLEGDYSAYFETADEAYAAQNKHQNKYNDHEVVISETIFLSPNND